MLSYRLVMLAHGDGQQLAPAFASFRQHVIQAPSSIYIHWDSAPPAARLRGFPSGCPLVIEYAPEPRGFCASTAAAWDAAAHGTGLLPESLAYDYEYVFWLEHDFRFRRTVDLNELVAVLEEPKVAQVALRRQPVSAEEVAAGGYVAMRPDCYTQRETSYAPADGFTGPMNASSVQWLDHDLFWTTNPSLFKRRLTDEYPWPVRPECEGHFGIALRAAGYRFALMGGRDDLPWVEHVGDRTGFGY